MPATSGLAFRIDWACSVELGSVEKTVLAVALLPTFQSTILVLTHSGHPFDQLLRCTSRSHSAQSDPSSQNKPSARNKHNKSSSILESLAMRSALFEQFEASMG